MLRAIFMSRLRKFFRLPRSERWLLLKAALLLGAIRIGLRLLPFQTLKQLLDSEPRSSRARPNGFLQTGSFGR